MTTIDRIIKNYVEGNPTYIYQISPTLSIPRILYRGGGHKPISLDSIRERALREEDSDISRQFREDVDSSHPGKYIREVPVLIEDQGLWEYAKSEFSVEPEKCGTSFFRLDYFFPRAALAVEIDGSYYHTTPNYDKARDYYIKIALGWDVLRLSDYCTGTADFARFEKAYKESILSAQPPPKILFSDTLIQNFYLEKPERREEVGRVRILLSHISPQRFMLPGPIEIKWEEVKYLMGPISRKEQEALRKLFKELMKKEIKIL